MPFFLNIGVITSGQIGPIMRSSELRAAVLSVIVGLAYFMLLIGGTQGLVALNANVSPRLPWFPLPALIVILLVTRWLNSRWDLRLRHPPSVSWPMAYTFALLATLAAMCLSLLEASFNGLTRTAPAWPDEEVSRGFQFTFVITLPFIASVLAEIGFRGIIQTRLEKIMPLWPMLLAIAILNALMHFYDPEQMSQWGRFIALNLAFGYVTWRTQSILPALAAHCAMNLVEPVGEYLFGPVVLGDASGMSLLTIAITGCVALVLALAIGRAMPRPVVTHSAA